MRLARSFRLATLFCLCLVALAGCTRKPTSTADMPRLLSPAYSVSVLPFIQPRSNAELVMGQLPEPQGHIDGSHLAILDNRLQTALRERKNSRRYAFVASGALPKISSGYSANQPQALPILAAFAAKSGTDFLLVPQVIDWHEREGSRAGVTRPAHVKVEFYLISAKHGTVANRSVYEEEQTGLADNLLNMGDFFRRISNHEDPDKLMRMLKNSCPTVVDVMTGKSGYSLVRDRNNQMRVGCPLPVSVDTSLLSIVADTRTVDKATDLLDYSLSLYHEIYDHCPFPGWKA